MTVELALVASMDVALEPRNRSIAFCARTLEVAPRFAEPFPVDPARLWFDGVVVPCFGIWGGLESGQRARLAAQVRVLRLRGADDFVAELLPANPGQRIVVARTTNAATLAEANAFVVRALRRRGGTLSRWLGRDRLAAWGGVRIPVLQALVEPGSTRLAIELGADGPEQPVPEWVVLGRGDLYSPYVLCNGPFVLWVGERGSLEPQLVAWIGRL